MSLESAFKEFELTGSAYYKLANIPMPETVSLRHMTVKEVKYFAQLAQSGDINNFIDSLLTSCSKDKFDNNNMLVGDRVYLFYMLRALTMGNQYEFQVTCRSCEKTIPAVVDLYTMGKKPYNEELGFPLKLEFKHSKKTVEFVLPTRGIEKAVEAEVKKFKQDTPNADPPEAVFQLRKLLKSVDGSNDFMPLLNFCDELHILDWVELDAKITEVSPGLDLDVIVTCQHCSFENKEKFSVRPQEFFRFQS